MAHAVQAPWSAGTETAEPKREKAKTDRQDPSHPKLRRLSEEPRCAKSITCGAVHRKASGRGRAHEILVASKEDQARLAHCSGS